VSSVLLSAAAIFAATLVFLGFVRLVGDPEVMAKIW
jgi:hypothetical protein